jgi:hypothetical protein
LKPSESFFTGGRELLSIETVVGNIPEVSMDIHEVGGIEASI